MRASDPGKAIRLLFRLSTMASAVEVSIATHTALRFVPDTDLAQQPALLPAGLANIATALYRGVPVQDIEAPLVARLAANPFDAGALHDIATLVGLLGIEHKALHIQQQALQLTRVFRREAQGTGVPLRLLMFAVPGNFMANTPVEFLLEGAPVQLDIVYLMPNEPIPANLPEHDVVLVGIAEAEETAPLLLQLGVKLATWPKPVLNMPGRILDTGRERLHEIIRALPGVTIPPTQRASRETLVAYAWSARGAETLLSQGQLPIVIRPRGTHAGEGLERVDSREQLLAYLAKHPEEQFFISPFVDYASPDGAYRKYRVAVIGGQFFLCHMAISSHWMVHYLNAGMAEDAEKRAEEAEAMATFAASFGRRHAGALQAIADTLGLDYVALDCAEMRDGSLLVFEAGTAMIVHRMDPPDLFPYKQVAMAQVCDAFVSLLRDNASR